MVRFFILTLLLFLGWSTQAQNGDNLFDDTFLHVIEINSVEPMSYEDFHTQLHDSHDQVFYDYTLEKDYFPATVIYRVRRQQHHPFR